MADRYDVAIIGGGLVGASLACALAPLGLRIALVEAVAFRAASQPSYDDRTLALSDSSCKILQGLDMWKSLESNATPIREIQVREFERPGRVVMKPAELGLDRFGHVVEARVFGASVMERIPGLDKVDFFCPAAVTRISTNEKEAAVEIEGNNGGEQIKAALLVGADGANSFVRESLGIEAERHDYRQTAIICNITPEQDHAGRAFECFPNRAVCGHAPRQRPLRPYLVRCVRPGGIDDGNAGAGVSRTGTPPFWKPPGRFHKDGPAKQLPAAPGAGA
jgi:2-octaprenyl-6-methoxyphenol hydroxylase